MYKHGAYGDLKATQDLVAANGISTLPVYFGIAPIHQLADYTDKVNKPILVQTFQEAVSKVGYNDRNWEKFDLCEPIYAHFKNQVQAIGPIVLVNVLDPNTMKGEDKTLTVNFINKQCFIESDLVILKTISISDKVLGTDFKVEYTADGSKVLITDLKGDLTASTVIKYNEVDLTKVTKTEIIGGVNATTGVRTGISVADLVYQTYNAVPTILDAPGWSHIPEVDASLKAASQKINGHWYAWVNSNLAADSNTNTTEKAKTWKTDKAYIAYNGAGETPCYPMALNGDRKFHLSTLTTVVMQQVDYANDNIPYETPSNKPIDITGLCLSNGTSIEFDKLQANDLNSKGIKTAIYWGGKWVLWGPHTGAYEEGKDMDPRDKFDCNIRMLYYMLNDFQQRYGIQVDKPMNRSRIDTILNDYQERLDSFISSGALLYGKIQFNETSNPVSDIVEGDFDFDISTTTTPPGKSINAKLMYTTKGINILFGGKKA